MNDYLNSLPLNQTAKQIHHRETNLTKADGTVIGHDMKLRKGE